MTALVLSTLSTQAQSDLKPLFKKLRDIILSKDASYLNKESVRKPVIMFSYAIGTDEQGKIDTIAFSNSIHPRDAEFMQLDKLKADLKKENFVLKDHTNSLLMGSVLIANGEHQELTASAIHWAWPRLYYDITPLIGKRKLVPIDPIISLFYFTKIMH